MIRRRSAIEPAIGHMKADGKLDRNWLKGALGDAIHAVLCGAGHNLRMILRKLRLFYALVLVRFAQPLNRCRIPAVRASVVQNELFRPDYVSDLQRTLRSRSRSFRSLRVGSRPRATPGRQSCCGEKSPHRAARGERLSGQVDFHRVCRENLRAYLMEVGAEEGDF